MIKINLLFHIQCQRTFISCWVIMAVVQLELVADPDVSMNFQLEYQKRLEAAHIPLIKTKGNKFLYVPQFRSIKCQTSIASLLKTLIRKLVTRTTALFIGGVYWNLFLAPYSQGYLFQSVWIVLYSFSSSGHYSPYYCLIMESYLQFKNE